MKRTLIVATILTIAYSVGIIARADEDADRFKELDAKISASLSKGDWSADSKTFVAAIWKDYQSTYLANRQELSTHSTRGETPEASRYDEYVGRYTRGGRPFVEITQNADGRFFVKLEGHVIPAVAINKSIVFTTGDVVRSRLPQLSDKPYASLEFFMVVRLGGKVYFTSPEAAKGERTEITKE